MADEKPEVLTNEPDEDSAAILTNFTRRERRIAEYHILALREQVRYGYWETRKIIDKQGEK